MKDKTCCFSGHRKISPIGTIDISIRMRKQIDSLVKQGYERFICGGALGFDTICALTVLNAKKKYKNIKLILALPCENQTKNWQQKDIEVYNSILKNSDEVIYISKNYFNGCMHKRNRYMVDNSSYCIYYLNKNSGGTAYTVQYAKKEGLKLKNMAVDRIDK